MRRRWISTRDTSFAPCPPIQKSGGRKPPCLEYTMNPTPNYILHKVFRPPNKRLQHRVGSPLTWLFLPNRHRYAPLFHCSILLRCSLVDQPVTVLLPIIALETGGQQRARKWSLEKELPPDRFRQTEQPWQKKSETSLLPRAKYFLAFNSIAALYNSSEEATPLLVVPSPPPPPPPPPW